MITNSINGKIYIGRTVQDLNKRWADHLCGINSEKNRHLRLYRAMKKYGVENFSIKQIDSANSFKELKEKEHKHIFARKSYDDKIGYNMSIDTSDGLELLSEESKVRRAHSIHYANASKNKAAHGKGVRKYRNVYYASIVFGGLNYNLPFSSVEAAKEAYDKMALYLHGEKACVNYPDRVSQYTKEDLENTYQNFKKTQEKPTSSKYFGVFKRSENIYLANINKDKKTYHLGSFQNEIDAAKEVDKARAYLYGPNTGKYNFPENITEYISNPESLKQWFLSITQNKTRGLSYDKRICMWGVSIKHISKRIGLGYYRDVEQAAKIRDMAVLYFKIDTPLNYPEYKTELEKQASVIISSLLSSKKRYKGIYRAKNGRYGAVVICNKKSVYIGRYDSEEEAARAYDKKAIELLGDKARLNFSNHSSSQSV